MTLEQVRQRGLWALRMQEVTPPTQDPHHCLICLL